MDRILILIIYALLTMIMYIDINKKYIPNILNFIILLLAIIYRGFWDIEIFFIGAACYSLPILIFYGYVSDILDREVFGFGDIKLIIGLGGLLYKVEQSLFLQIYIFYLLVFSLATLYLLSYYIFNLTQKKKIKLRGKEIAFAPYICISFFILNNINFLGFAYE